MEITARNTSKKISKKLFENYLRKTFDNLSFDVAYERQPNYTSGELSYVKITLYYENDKHIASWSRGSGVVFEK